MHCPYYRTYSTDYDYYSVDVFAIIVSSWAIKLLSKLAAISAIANKAHELHFAYFGSAEMRPSDTDYYQKLS